LPVTQSFTLTVYKEGSNINNIQAQGCALTWQGAIGTCTAEKGTHIVLTAKAAGGYNWNGWEDKTGSASLCYGFMF